MSVVLKGISDAQIDAEVASLQRAAVSALDAGSQWILRAIEHTLPRRYNWLLKEATSPG
ncbi:MAG: hypothetical protein NTU79_06405 [Planctomycetota bacterium]|nr:hypothetical protein [Planctomycetota bacterium]